MIDAKEYFDIDYWGDNWYEIDEYKQSFISDVFWFDIIGLSHRSKIKYFFKNLLKYRLKYIKNIIYYLPACWYMLKMYIKHKIK